MSLNPLTSSALIRKGVMAVVVVYDMDMVNKRCFSCGLVMAMSLSAILNLPLSIANVYSLVFFTHGFNCPLPKL